MSYSLNKKISETILETLQPGQAYTSREIASIVQLPLNAVTQCLYKMVKKNQLETHKADGKSYWNLPPNKEYNQNVST